MLRRNRFWVIGLLITVTVVILCLFVPDILLAVDRQHTIGQVQQGRQQYYANDVAADDGSGFNFQRRLMMLSGKWRSEKVEAQVQEGMLGLDGFERCCSRAAQTVFEFIMNGISDDEAAYINDVLVSISEQLESEQDRAAAQYHGSGNTELPAETHAFSDPGHLLFNMGNPTLYQYSDSVLNSYTFYVWEYDLKIPLYDIELHLMMDAVTLDLYSFSVKCADDFLTGELENLLTSSIHIIDEEIGYVFIEMFEKQGISFPGLVPLMIPFFIDLDNYHIHADDMTGGKEFSVSGEPGYTYREGHFLESGPLETEMLYGDVLKLVSGNQTVYARMEFDQGVKFYFTSDAPETEGF